MSIQSLEWIVILSMTGCGYARIQGETNIITVEVKSVNSRYLDINCKIPRAYSRLEEKIKAFAGGFTTRGKMDIYLSSETAPGTADVSLSIDEAFLLNYLDCLKQLHETYGLKDDISVMSVAQNKDVFTSVRPDETVDELWAKIEPSLTAAFTDFVDMKQKEGDRLATDILGKLDVLSGYVDTIAAHAPKVIQEYETRLTERIEDMCKDLDIDKGRIVEEVAIFADRVAIDEEIVRLRSHLKQFKDMIQENKSTPCGRKLDFLLQEINREINTTGSKCTDADIAKVVVDAKSEAEKIREQIQNIE